MPPYIGGVYDPKQSPYGKNFCGTALGSAVPVWGGNIGYAYMLYPVFTLFSIITKEKKL